MYGWMWELDCEESWALKNRRFWIVMLEKTLESPLDCKQIQPVRSEGDQPWDFFGRNDARAEAPVLWPPHVKSWLIGKESDAGRDWEQEEKGTTEGERAGWHHGLDGRESEWTLGDGDGWEGLACCGPWGRKESDMTERLKWTELNWTSMCTAVLFTIARTWKQPGCPSANEWIKKLWYIYTMEYYLAIKSTKFESVLIRWMKLEPSIRSEVSHKEKHKYCILIYMYGIWRHSTDEFIFRVTMEKQT